MKKTLLALAATSALVSVAHAQSSVTLYGLIDASVVYTNNAGAAGHKIQAGSGAINSPRWGMRGTEDLGGGLSAIFVLESGFNIQNGTSSQDSRLFGRQAFVGLASTQYGAVTLGRQYDSVVDFLAPLSATGSWGGTWFQHPFDNDNLNNSFRVDNAVKYTSPVFAGLKVGAMYAFSNNQNFAANRLYSFGANYNWGPLKAAAGYLQVNGSAGNQGTPTNSTAGAVDQAENSAVTQDKSLFGTNGFQIASTTQRIFGGGVNYSIGPALLGFVYTQSQYYGSLSGTYKFNNYEANAKYNLTPALSIAGNYTYTDGHISSGGAAGASKDPGWSQVDLQVDYALSKRTDVYVEGMYQHAIGNKNSAFIAGSGGTSSTSNQVMALTGIRTRF
jgi:general bacterial porin, GBP family